jgi:cell wall-associated NlpC family hydrolase
MRAARPAPRRRHLLLAATAVGLLALPSLPGVTAAQPESSVEDLREQAADLADRLEELDLELSVLDEQASAAAIALDEQEAAIAEATARAEATRTEVDEHQGELREYAIRAYVAGGEPDAASMLASADTDDATEQRGYLTAAADAKRDLVAGLQAAQADLDAELAELEAAKARAEEAAAELDAAREATEDAVREQEELLEGVQGDLAAALAEEEEQRRAKEALEAARQAELAATEARAASRPAGTTPASAPPAGSPATPSTVVTTSTTVAPTTPTTEPEAPSGPDVPAPTPPPAPTPGGVPGAEKAVAAAYSMLGTPYVWGGASPSGGFDCSGLTMWAWKQAGRSLPHSSAAQYGATRRIPMSDIKPGDLIFYGKPTIHHVALYIGDGKIIHAPNRRSVVRVDSVYYWSELVGAGRLP